MTRLRILFVPGLILATAFAVFAESKAEKQAKARKKADETLARLYKQHPSAQAAIRKAVGYAVFNNGGAKILIAGGGKSHWASTQCTVAPCCRRSQAVTPGA